MAKLEQAYTSTFGSPTSKGQLYGGFWLLLAGVFGVLAGLALFYVGNAQTREAMWEWRKAGLALAAISAPLIFFGASFALPSKKGMRATGVVGLALCALASLFFIWAYPLHFNVAGSSQADYTGHIAGVYALGLVLIIVGLFTSLIGYYLDRVQAAAAVGTGQQSEDAAYGYEVPDSIIEKDIEQAMKKYRYAWGEAGGASATGIQINIHDEFEKGVTVGGKGVARTVQLESPQVDEATRILRGIRPATEKSVSGDWEADQTKALLAFRKQKAEQVAVKQATAKRMGFWARLWAWITGRKASAPAPTDGKNAK